MKSRSNSPQTSPQIRKYRVDSRESATALRKASFRVEELPPINMNTSFQGSSPAPERESYHKPGLLGPVPAGVRRVSGESTPSRPVLNGNVSSPAVPVASPHENESPSQWSSAVGHATTSGKSGRVIEKLMAENDRLKRDLEIAVMKSQELEKNLATLKPQMDALQAENDNLSHSSTVDSSILARKERRIEELRADSAAKAQRALAAETQMRQQQRQLEELHEQHSRDHQSMLDQTKHATVHAEILETSHKQLSAEYRARREAWERDLAVLHQERDDDRARMARLDVVHEQMRQENERTRKVQTELMARWEDMEQAMHSTLEEGEQENEKTRKKSLEMDQVVNQMKWLMGVQKTADEIKARSTGKGP
ncbi:hypothetical protein KC332_g11128 [Hortaea werneckii]|uniref:SWI5-dependent HO expression protein 3 n=2 Tax=Hortaea werneckii TaxID=91943 RepID=A0A3M7JC53_HORWE|nr:hypothetical protein KC358_g11190 [Hortaea werneckii]OTA36233.1 hypothetical protein BTJ68_05433 [Hortaea werneckii EXF-2000]KAI6842499.1 hypothetical protein KC350_g5047 [Hortaea werneckii]KAI6916725.1 hypothetical protein KC348_g11418 [Hortaea werneckii]KAI6938753.1 hypothetical protein KC341_g4692 [Hortaea werneckii]